MKRLGFELSATLHLYLILLTAQTWFVSAFSNQTLDFKGECKNNREQVFTSLLCLQQFYNDV